MQRLLNASLILIATITVYISIAALAPTAANATNCVDGPGVNCSGATIIIPPSGGDYINCKRAFACQDLTIHFMQPAGVVDLQCSGPYACNGLSVTVEAGGPGGGWLDILCLSEITCENMDIQVPSGAVFGMNCYVDYACSNNTLDLQTHRISGTDYDLSGSATLWCGEDQFFNCSGITALLHPEQTGYYTENGFQNATEDFTCNGLSCFFIQAQSHFCPLGTFHDASLDDPDYIGCHNVTPGHYLDAYSGSDFGPQDQLECFPGTYQSGFGAQACDLAPAGSYVSLFASAAATACPIGQYQPFDGQTHCLASPAGSYVPLTGSIAATLCPVGTYQDQIGQASCTLSPANYFVDSVGAIAPTACPAGTGSDPGSDSLSDCMPVVPDCLAGSYLSGNVCVAASPGYFVADGGATEQVACPAGAYQPDSGQTFCLDADPGHFVDQVGQVQQTACPVGTYQPDSGQDFCLASPAGSFVSVTGSIAATLCPLGTYQDETGQAACNQAPAGTYVDGIGSIAAQPCSVGEYQPLIGQTSCNTADPGYFVDQSGQALQSACAVGTYQPDSGQAFCLASPAGSFVSVTGSIAATLCQLGTYQDETGQAVCKPAPAGSYVDTIGALAATPCPPGKTSEAGATTCVVLPPPVGTITVTPAASLNGKTADAFAKELGNLLDSAGKQESKANRFLTNAAKQDGKGNTEEADWKRAQAANSVALQNVYAALAATVDLALGSGGTLTVEQQDGLFDDSIAKLQDLLAKFAEKAANDLAKATEHDNKADKYQAQGKLVKASEERAKADALRDSTAIWSSLIAVLELSLP